MKRRSMLYTTLALLIFAFQPGVFNASAGVEPASQSTPTIEKQKPATQLIAPSREIRGNKQACQEYCKKTGNCTKCVTGKDCGAGYQNIKRWTGASGEWTACKKTEYSR